MCNQWDEIQVQIELLKLLILQLLVFYKLPRINMVLIQYH